MLQKLKIFCLVSALSYLSASCVTKPGDLVQIPEVSVSLYTIQPNDDLCPVDETGMKASWCAGKSGLFRPKDKQFLSLGESKGYIAMSFEDFLKLLGSCPN